jgi:hypothetical protein
MSPTCTECGHERRQHSREGCGECPCKVKYMEREKFPTK